MTRYHRILLFSIALLLAASLGTQADTIRLKSGRLITGKVERFANGEFVIRLDPADSRSGYDRMILLIDAVESVEFDAGGAPPAVAGSAGEKVVQVEPREEALATGVQLRRGDRVRITASGEIELNDGRRSGPAGRAETESWPFPNAPRGVLVAMVGSPTSPTYEIVGEGKEFAAASDGELYLQINADPRYLQGARGSYSARITLLSGTPAPPPSPMGSPTPPPQPDRRQLSHQLEVPADKAWFDTSVDLYEGDTLRITAEGTINYTSSKTCGPEGEKPGWRSAIGLLPVADAGRGALIGQIGESPAARPFLVGPKYELSVPSRGRLSLGINDDDYGNNRGSFRVRIEVVPARR